MSAKIISNPAAKFRLANRLREDAKHRRDLGEMARRRGEYGTEENHFREAARLENEAFEWEREARREFQEPAPAPKALYTLLVREPGDVYFSSALVRDVKVKHRAVEIWANGRRVADFVTVNRYKPTSAYPEEIAIARSVLAHLNGEASK